MKNDIFFPNGTIRYHLDMLYRGTYTGVHFIKKLPEKVTLAPLQTGAWWRHLFETGGNTSMKMKRNPCQGWV